MTFKLRPWLYEDLPSLVKYANNKNIARYMTDTFAFPYTEENGRNFLSFATKESHRIFAIDVGEEAVGGIGLHPQYDIQRKNAELGYWLAEPFWGNGIITSAIKQIVGLGFRQMDITRIFARPFGDNKASQRVLEKAEFKLEALYIETLFKNGLFVDEHVYAIRKKDFSL